MEILKQLRLWVEGNSVHNEERDECCPDFSCCEPSLLAPKHEREAFEEAYKRNDTEIVNKMLLKFLDRAFSSPEIYIVGSNNNHVYIKKEK